LIPPIFCATETQKPPKHVEQQRPDTYRQVFNIGRERVRGLWTKNDRYYAQLDANNGGQYRYHLEHPNTVPQAMLARQALKLKQQTEVGFLPPGRNGKKEGQKMVLASLHFSRGNDQNLLQHAVLPLQFFQPPSLVHFDLPKLLLPAVIRHLQDVRLVAKCLDGLLPAIRFQRNPHLVFRRIPFAFHRLILSSVQTNTSTGPKKSSHITFNALSTGACGYLLKQS